MNWLTDFSSGQRHYPYSWQSKWRCNHILLLTLVIKFLLQCSGTTGRFLLVTGRGGSDREMQFGWWTLSSCCEIITALISLFVLVTIPEFYVKVTEEREKHCCWKWLNEWLQWSLIWFAMAAMPHWNLGVAWVCTAVYFISLFLKV